VCRDHSDKVLSHSAESAVISAESAGQNTSHTLID